MSSFSSCARLRRGISLVEIIVVVGVIVVLIGVLVPALSSVRDTSLMSSSQSNLRQVHTYMTKYASDNRDIIVPSQFDYRPDEFEYKGKVRNNMTPLEGAAQEGTWTDILWTVFEVDSLPFMADTAGHAYEYDSPDKAVYELNDGYSGNPFRSADMNTRDAELSSSATDIARPFGSGAQESTLPGFFAANDYFNARGSTSVDPAEDRHTRSDPVGSPNLYDISTPPPAAGRWHTNGQIAQPLQAMYVVDSFAGEVIDGEFDPAWVADPTLAGDWHNGSRLTSAPGPGVVDFRYNNVALMLFLDGHIDTQGSWDTIDELDRITLKGGRRNIQITRLSGE